MAYRGNKTSEQTSAVEEHVEAVRDEPEGVGPDAIEELHEGKRKI